MFNEDSSSSGRVKGSIKDRIVSFLYRKRFKIRLLRNKLIKKETKVIFIFRKKQEIKNYHDLKKMGDKVIEVDVKKEKFDFDKYDYYIIEPVKKKGVDTAELKQVKDTKKVIDYSMVLLDSVKKDINKVDVNLKYPDIHKEDLTEETNRLINNVNKLKDELNKLDIVDVSKLNSFKVPSNEEELKRSYEIVDYYVGIVSNKAKDNNVVKTINNVSLKKQVGLNVNNIMNSIVNKDDITFNKNTNTKRRGISSVKNIKIYKPSKKSVDKKLESKKTIKALNKFDGFKIRQLKRNEERVKKDVAIATHIIDNMNKEVNKVTKEVSHVTKTTGYTRMITSCLRVATGILTLPFSKVNLFNITLGSALINRGLKGLRKGLETKSEIKVDYKYEDLSNMIKATKDKTKLTELLIMDSLTEIKSIKESTYLGDNNIKDLNKVEENLNKKLKEIDKLNKKLNKQDEKNKIKIKKVKDKEL